MTLAAAQFVEASIGSDACQPPFERTTPFEAGQLPIRLEKDLLRNVFNLIALTKELAGYLKHARTVTTHDLLKGVLIAPARATY